MEMKARAKAEVEVEAIETNAKCRMQTEECKISPYWACRLILHFALFTYHSRRRRKLYILPFLLEKN